MIISSSIVSLESQHVSAERHSVRENLRFWTGGSRPDFEGRSHAGPAATVSISEAAQAAQSQEAEAIQNSEEEVENDPRTQLIRRMVEAMTGQKIRLIHAHDLQPDEEARQHIDHGRHVGEAIRQARAGWGMEYDRQESHYESEQTTFSAQGVIRTADGKEIRFELQLQMQREFVQESSVSLRAGDAIRKDPLVINFDGAAAQLSTSKFAFDIDSDGAADQISFVGPGSGFLALDLNRNGKIDNGTELFGTQSGNGFADLARYDSDGNQWIDENDPVFADLRIWSRNAAGTDSLSTLAQRNVGALYLGSVPSPFSIKDANNAALGQVRSSGIFLTGNSSAGTLQQVDLFV